MMRGNDLGRDSVPKLVLRLAVPTMIAQFVNVLYSIIDRMYIGNIPENGAMALAGVGICGPIVTLLSSFGTLVGLGGSILMAMRMGEGDDKKAKQILSNSFLMLIAFSVVLTVMFLLLKNKLLMWFGASEATFSYADTYLSIYTAGTFFALMAVGLNYFINCQGFSTVGMTTVLIGAIANIVLDPIFIFVFDLGVAGAAIATSLSQLVGLIILIIFTNKKSIPLTVKNIRINGYYIKEIFRGGLPSLFRQGCSSISFVLLNHAAGVYGDAAIAAMTVVQKIVMFAASAMIGYGQGFQPVCGFNFGAKKYDRVKNGVSFCIKSSLIVLVILAVLGYSFAPWLVARFRDDAEVIAIGTRTLRWQCLTFPLMGWIIICNMLVQTIGYTVRASILATARQFLFFVPCLFILSAVFGLAGIEAAQAASDAIAFAVSVFIGYDVLKKMK